MRLRLSWIILTVLQVGALCSAAFSEPDRLDGPDNFTRAGSGSHCVVVECDANSTTYKVPLGSTLNSTVSGAGRIPAVIGWGEMVTVTSEAAGPVQACWSLTASIAIGSQVTALGSSLQPTAATQSGVPVGDCAGFRLGANDKWTNWPRLATFKSSRPGYVSGICSSAQVSSIPFGDANRIPACVTNNDCREAGVVPGGTCTDTAGTTAAAAAARAQRALYGGAFLLLRCTAANRITVCPEK